MLTTWIVMIPETVATSPSPNAIHLVGPAGHESKACPGVGVSCFAGSTWFLSYGAQVLNNKGLEVLGMKTTKLSADGTKPSWSIKKKTNSSSKRIGLDVVVELRTKIHRQSIKDSS
jgi:hypothetical protein